MARWFDNAAKAAASREVAGTPPVDGFSRRTALKRGAVVAGVAWTAPMLMQTRAYAGASKCGSGLFFCAGSTDALSTCCKSASGSTKADTCAVYKSGQAYCIPPGSPGGTCTNSGVGVCNDGTNRTNCNGPSTPPQCNSCAAPYVCGGEAAPCNEPAVTCAPGLVCVHRQGSTGTFCSRQCASDAGCYTGQICDSTSYCSQTCSQDSDCQGTEKCISDVKSPTGKICSYV